MSGYSYALCGAPGTGKTAALDKLVIDFQRSPPRSPVLVEDNEWGFSMPMRVLCAEKSGLTLNSPEFVRAFNFRGQLDYQAACRNRASQGFTVVMPGPFEDLTPLIPVGDEKVPLLEKMKCDFSGRIKFYQLLLVPRAVEITSANVMDEPAMQEIEAVIQNRIKSRAVNGDAQVLLDSDKHAPDYYRQRLRKLLVTSERFPEVTRILTYPGETPEEVARKIRIACDF